MNGRDVSLLLGVYVSCFSSYIEYCIMQSMMVCTWSGLRGTPTVIYAGYMEDEFNIMNTDINPDLER